MNHINHSEALSLSAILNAHYYYFYYICQIEEGKEGLGQMMWRISAAWVIQNVLEWQKVERNGVPWQSSIFEVDGTTHSDSESREIFMQFPFSHIRLIYDVKIYTCICSSYCHYCQSRMHNVQYSISAISFVSEYCEAGLELVNGNCNRCARGFYKDNVVVSRFSNCSKCTTNTTDDDGANSSSLCNIRKLFDCFIAANVCYYYIHWWLNHKYN
mgnify:CR=1 FL=1